jgi:hypothetical protein
MENNLSNDGSPSSAEESYSFINRDKLQKGSSFFVVKDVDLACCLISIGIKLRIDPPVYNVKLPNGSRDVAFYFCSESDDGQFVTEQMARGYYNDAKFVQENPEHPMAYAIATVKNKVALKNALDKSTPCLAYRKTQHSGAVIYVQEGSKKHANCVAKGMVHVDPKVQVVIKTKE